MEKRYYLPKDLPLENFGIYALIFGIRSDQISANKHHSIFLHRTDGDGNIYHLVDRNANNRREPPDWHFEHQEFNAKQSVQLAQCIKMGSYEGIARDDAGFMDLHKNIVDAFQDISIKKDDTRDIFNCVTWFADAVKELGEIGMTVSIESAKARVKSIDDACKRWESVGEVTVI